MFRERPRMTGRSFAPSVATSTSVSISYRGCRRASIAPVVSSGRFIEVGIHLSSLPKNLTSLLLKRYENRTGRITTAALSTSPSIHLEDQDRNCLGLVPLVLGACADSLVWSRHERSVCRRDDCRRRLGRRDKRNASTGKNNCPTGVP